MIQFIQEDQGSDGLFLAVEHGKKIGEIDYEWTTPQLLTITYTEVSPDYQGQGIGKSLVSSCVDFARKQNFKIFPRCKFARDVFAKNPELCDVLP